ncbi:TetR family transcriptional regulator [Streptomyces sp. NPDC058620]|uniref:TetR family transcriptional regulator n=1 Tax=Streptomyces sp. NPDC058620 TaxID=3346560 RepID=UPI0036582283
MSRAEATKLRILQAATDEFATHGIAGARVDRIASAASANKNLIYVYFCSKDQLFDAVFDAHVAHGLNMVPFTPEDLPGYAGRLFDFCLEHPEVIRLAAWHRLERGDTDTRDPALVSPTRDAKLEALAKVQAETGIAPGFSAPELLTLVLAIATAWSPTNATSMPASTTSGPTPDERRRAITEAVRSLL